MSSDQRHGWWSVVRPPTLAGFCDDYMAGSMVVVSPSYLSGKGGNLRLRPKCEEKCTVESACRRMRLDGSMAEGRLDGSMAERNECTVVVVIGDEWLLGEGQLVEGEQPTGGLCSSRASTPRGLGGCSPSPCSQRASSPGGHASLGRVAPLLA